MRFFVIIDVFGKVYIRIGNTWSFLDVVENNNAWVS